jgi:aminoglycoside phosphotransferase (APT) family kinase protein
MREAVGVGRSAEVFAGSDGTVVKLFYGWVPAHLVDAEERGTAAAFAAGASAPRLIDRVEQDGRAGLILERVAGPSMLAELTTHPWRLLSLAAQLARLHADIHRRSGAGLPVLREQLRSQIGSITELSTAARDRSLALLETLPDGDRILHGDLHPDNVILAARGAVAIDWMGAACGDRAADAARTALILELGSPPRALPAAHRAMITAGRRAFRAGWLRAYIRASGVRRADIAAWRRVIAAARLCEGIEDERRALCAIVEAATAN